MGGSLKDPDFPGLSDINRFRGDFSPKYAGLKLLRFGLLVVLNLLNEKLRAELGIEGIC